MSFRVRQFGILLLSLSVGCATTGSNWGFSRVLGRGETKLKQQSEPSPARPVQKAEEPKEPREPLVADAESSSSPSTRHDPATRMLIEAELRDATPAERTEWMSYLNSVQAAQVPYILKARRMAESRAKEALANAASSGEQNILPAGHTDLTPQSKGESVSSGPAETRPVLEGPGPAVSEGPGAVAGWQKKIKSLTDPNWLWSHPPVEGEESAAGEKSERGPFGLPLVLGMHPRGEAPHNSANTNAAPALPLEAPPRRLPVPPPAQGQINPGSALWEDEIHKLISLLEAETSSQGISDTAAEERQHLRQQVALRMLYLAADVPQKAQQPIPGLEPAEQEFWTSLFLGLAEYLEQEEIHDPAERATQMVAQLRTAAHQLQQSARLQMRNVTFCQRINGFGNYETFDANEFTPGQTALIYAEIRNFTSEPTVDGAYRTRIKSTIEIYSGGVERMLIDRSDFEATEDLCRTPRSDYYHSYRLDLPSQLSPGPHVLKILIQDELSGKLATESLYFTVR